MRINKLVGFAIGASGAALGVALMNAEISNKEKLNDCKMEILTKDPQRFLQLSKSSLEHNQVNWYNEANIMNDSVKNAQKAYFEGAQLIQENKDR